VTEPPADGAPLTYRSAGVDIDAGDDAVARIAPLVRATHRPEVLADIGGFGGLFAPRLAGMAEPVLVASTDGVGTKSKVAQLVGRFDTIGIDCVAMSVDDIVVQGAEPLFFLDYVSVGKLDPDVVEQLVAGVAHGCSQAGCALLGGEMSEHPGLLDPGEFDLVGFAVGVADRARLLPAQVRAGDALVGIESPGLRCNGYSLARRALLERAGRRLDEPAWPGADRTLGEELLVPSVVYARAALALAEAVPVRALAHVTGGGIPGNLARVLPAEVGAVVRRGTWPEPRIFAEVQRAGDVADAEMVRVFNLGIGMIAVVAPDAVDAAVASLAASGHAAFPIGEAVEGHGEVAVV
jgi:phosphoribosylformylglycinamidine cyclo-ligase